jgi:hypothetical protein
VLGNYHSMKKSMTLMLLAALIPGAAMASAVAPITPQQALAHQGKCVTVTGTGSLRADPQRLGFDLDVDGKDSPFFGYIPRENRSQFPELDNLSGGQVAVSGVVQFYHGRAEIELTSAHQLKPVSSEDTANGLTAVGPEYQRFNAPSAVCG